MGRFVDRWRGTCRKWFLLLSVYYNVACWYSRVTRQKVIFPNLSSVLVLHGGASVVSSSVIIAHIMWTRRRFESQVIMTHSHRLESFRRQFCVDYVVHPA